ncbi:MAG: cell wall-binding repeat-containing protein [Coriobacteriia bacterium]|nr:cell wall-binding repeat-containing protein [Coriobacteriia bacterium]
MVKEALAARWIDLDTLGFATGLDFPDALGGGAALGYYGSGLLLTRADALPEVVDTFLADHEYEIGRADMFGGTTVVSESVKSAVYDALR